MYFQWEKCDALKANGNSKCRLQASGVIEAPAVCVWLNSNTGCVSVHRASHSLHHDIKPTSSFQGKIFWDNTGAVFLDKKHILIAVMGLSFKKFSSEFLWILINSQNDTPPKRKTVNRISLIRPSYAFN